MTGAVLLALVTASRLGEGVLRLLRPGTHNPQMFITPNELRAALHLGGLQPGPFTGLGPRSVDRRGDLTFGRWLGTSVIYLGSATKCLTAPN